ncbi:MAG: hypothetical protein AAGA23_21030 [Pseudomonadota bacterium]
MCRALISRLYRRSRGALVVLALCGGTTAGAAPVLDTGLNGSWWNPDQDGQGFVIHLIPASNQIFVAWFTFENSESGKQMWLTGSGNLDSNPVSLELLSSTGGRLNAAEPAPSSTVWGTAELRFDSCTGGVFSYSGARSGSISIERLTPVVSCTEGAR